MQEDQRAEWAGMAGGNEHLLVWSWRRMAMAGTSCPLLAREFSILCGGEAGEVLATFDTFLRALAYSSRRRMQLGHPGCVAVTRDERQMLALVAAAQAHDRVRLEAHLCWLARPELRRALEIAALALGDALGAHGILLLPDGSAGRALPGVSFVAPP